MNTEPHQASILKRILKTVLGLVFVVSAVLKIFDMDQFEIYIYSYHFFSLNFSFLVARAAIIAELVLGIGLISNCFHKLMWWGSVLMLIGYCLLLLYAMILGRTDNCHCFGDYLQFNPLQSLAKNLVLLALFALVYKMEGRRFKYQWAALVTVALACTGAVFAVNPPDNFLSSYRPSQELQAGLLQEALRQPPLEELDLAEGRKVIGIFSSSCDICMKTAHKLSLMQSYYGFPEEDVVYVFMGTKEGVEKFFEESESTQYQYVIYDDIQTLLRITNGNFPIVVFLENGVVAHEYGFRNMVESEIKEFFQQ